MYPPPSGVGNGIHWSIELGIVGVTISAFLARYSAAAGEDARTKTSDRGGSHAERHMAWARGFFDAMRPHAGGRVYLKLPRGADRVRQAYGSGTYDRLVELKRTYDRPTSSGSIRTSSPESEPGVSPVRWSQPPREPPSTCMQALGESIALSQELRLPRRDRSIATSAQRRPRGTHRADTAA
jgi:hypothetical protein